MQEQNPSQNQVSDNKKPDETTGGSGTGEIRLGGSVEYNPFVRKPRPPREEKPAEEKKEPEVKENPMREIRVAKVVVNVGVGEAGERLLRADKMLQMLTGQKPVHTVSKTTNKDLGIRKGMEIGTKVTLRGKKAEEFLERAFWVMQNKIMAYSFDPEGNFSFGISDHTSFKGVKYDPEIGVFGMDISAVLRRRGGARVAERRMLRRKIPKKHRITREEGIEFVKKRFNVEVISE